MNELTPKWKKFEELVADIQRALSGTADVEANVRIMGTSGVPRQIDVAVRKTTGQFSLLIIMDCKDWKAPVDIKGVEEFAGLVEDVKANKGAMVCNKGFTAAAKTKATQKGIDLFSAIDSESKDWPVYVSIPTICDFRSIKSFRFSFRHSDPTPFMIPSIDPRLLELFARSGEKIDTLGNIVKRAWNEGKLCYEPGEYADLSICEQAAYTKVDEILYGPVQVKATITVESTLYFGQFPIAQTKGFKDEISGAFWTNSFTTADLNPTEIERTWQRIQAPEELAVKPGMMLVAHDYYPLVQTVDRSA
ncbi:MAG: restriction endonuclease [Elusimicrobiota bacterium]